VFDHWNGELRRRHGSPEAEFAVLALGKLGGSELNHSSDIDLMFLYSQEGQLSSRFSYHEFFNRLGKKILETFSTRDSAGSLFRVDLRLRPEGSAGPLARSLESMENYYGGFGETRARQAFLKEASTLRALRGLAELELVPRREILELDRAYRFLRRTEHRLQIEAEQQTHVLPLKPEELKRLALSLGFLSSEEFTAAR